MRGHAYNSRKRRENSLSRADLRLPRTEAELLLHPLRVRARGHMKISGLKKRNQACLSEKPGGRNGGPATGRSNVGDAKKKKGNASGETLSGPGGKTPNKSP